MSDVENDLHRAIQSVRAKYLLAKRARLAREVVNEEIFKPITTRLDVLRRSDETPQLSVKTEVSEDDGETVKKQRRDDVYSDRDKDVAKPDLQLHGRKVRKHRLAHNAPVRRYLVSYTSKNNDTTYGVHRYDNKWFLGSKVIRFLPGDLVQIEDEYTTHGTPGLYELLFRKEPKKFTEDDLQEYKKLLELTHAHYMDNDPDTGAYKDGHHEKIGILADLFKDLTVAGEGLRKIEDSRDIGYVYWDDPNELVDRLRLLIASQRVGNYSHTNEIISIIEELKEAGYVE